MSKELSPALRLVIGDKLKAKPTTSVLEFALYIQKITTIEEVPDLAAAQLLAQKIMDQSKER